MRYLITWVLLVCLAQALPPLNNADTVVAETTQDVTADADVAPVSSESSADNHEESHDKESLLGALLESGRHVDQPDSFRDLALGDGLNLFLETESELKSTPHHHKKAAKKVAVHEEQDDEVDEADDQQLEEAIQPHKPTSHHKRAEAASEEPSSRHHKRVLSAIKAASVHPHVEHKMSEDDKQTRKVLKAKENEVENTNKHFLDQLSDATSPIKRAEAMITEATKLLREAESRYEENKASSTAEVVEDEEDADEGNMDLELQAKPLHAYKPHTLTKPRLIKHAVGSLF